MAQAAVTGPGKKPDDVLSGPLRQLGELDDRLRSVKLRSLAPERPRPTGMRELGQSCLSAELGTDVAIAFADALCTIAEAQLRHFPENIFSDFDVIAGSLLKDATPTAHDAAETVRDRTDIIVRLLAMFGCESPIRFRYVHDFTYGFDWAKWVAKQPEERSDVGPFDREFLLHLRRRASEIDQSALPEGRYRNPFPMSREPDDETCLLEALAGDELIPVAAWREDGAPRWQLPFANLRLARAEALGIAPN